VLHATRKSRRITTYTIANRSEHERVMLVEHVYDKDWTLVTPEKPAEQTRDMYRFEVKVPPGQSRKLNVAVDRDQMEKLVFRNLEDEKIELYLQSKGAGAKVKEALTQGLKLRAEMRGTKRELDSEDHALREVVLDQERLRANLARVPQTSEPYKRFMQKLDDQETEIEKRRAKIATLQARWEDQQNVYGAFILELNVE
jgi:hypothetical protein